MKRSWSLSFVAVLGAGCVLANAPMARACSVSPCWNPSVFPSGGEIPADQFRLRFQPGADLRQNNMISEELKRAELFEVTTGARDAVTPVIAMNGNGSVLSLADAPAPGTKLVLEAPAPASCADAGFPVTPLRAEFTITASVAIPDSLGQLTAAVKHEMLSVATRAGSCTVKIEAAYADLKVVLSDGAKPFVNVIDYKLLLDGTPVDAFSDSLSGGTWLPRGEERVYAPCVPIEHLDGASELGMHRAKMRGTLPDGQTIESEEVMFELSCGAVAPAQPMQGTANHSNAGSMAPAGPAAAQGSAGIAAQDGKAAQGSAGSSGSNVQTASALGSAGSSAPEAQSTAGVPASDVRDQPRTAAAAPSQSSCNVVQPGGALAPLAWLNTAMALLCGLALRARRASKRE